VAAKKSARAKFYDHVKSSGKLKTTRFKAYYQGFILTVLNKAGILHQPQI
jgi:hypothetical protein